MTKPSRWKIGVTALAGLLAGGGAAAVYITFSNGSGTTSPGLDSVGLSDNLRRGFQEEWTRLNAEGKRGVELQLCMAAMAAQATVGEWPGLLEMAGRDAGTRELLLRRWVALDPAGAAAWVAPLMKGDWPGPPGREKDVEIVFSAWAKTDPQAALARIRAETVVGERVLWTGIVVNRLIAEDMEAGVRLAAMTGSSSTLEAVIYRGMDDKWVDRDPSKAAGLLAELPPGEFRDEGLRRIMNLLAEKDLDAAIALNAKFPCPGGGYYGGQPRDGFFRAWAARDPTAVEAYLNTQAAANERPVIKAALARGMAQTNPVAALEWAAGHLQGDSRAEVTGDILTNMTRKDPSAAMAWLETLTEGAALRQAVETYCKALPGQNAEGLLEMAQALPESPARAALTSRAYEDLYRREPDTFLQNLAAGETQDLPEGIWKDLGATTDQLEDGIRRAGLLPPEAGAEFVRGMFEKRISSNSTLAGFAGAMEQLTDTGQRVAALDAGLEKLFWNNRSGLVDWARTLPESERAQVAAMVEKQGIWLSAGEREKLLEPLR
jgi:hypothetical protein